MGSKFEAGIGAEAVKKLLEGIDLDALYTNLRAEVRATNSVAKRQKLSKRLRIVDAFRRSGLITGMDDHGGYPGPAT